MHEQDFTALLHKIICMNIVWNVAADAALAHISDSPALTRRAQTISPFGLV
jgi:hypothetical protein